MSSLGLKQGLGASTFSFTYDFTLISDKLWIEQGLGVEIWLKLCFWTGLLFQDQQKMLI